MKIKKSLVEQIIKEEVIKFRKLNLLKEEKAKIEKTLNELYEDEFVDEGLFSFGAKETEANKAKFMQMLDAAMARIPQGMQLKQGFTKEDVLAKAQKNGFSGVVKLNQAPNTGDLWLNYIPGKTGFQGLTGAAKGATNTYSSGGHGQ